MYEQIWCPVETKHSMICVAVYDDKVGFLSYEGDNTREENIGTPTYTVDHIRSIIAKIDEAIAFKGKHNNDFFVYEESVPMQYLMIEAHTLQKTGRNVFRVTSVMNYGDWEAIEDPVYGIDGLTNLKKHLQIAIEKIEHKYPSMG